MSFINAVKSGYFIAKNVIVKNLPKICIGMGIVLVTAGTIDACVQTTKAHKVLEEHDARMADIHRATKLSAKNEIEYTDDDKRKDTFATYGKTALGYFKLYWRPALMYIGGFASIFYGFGVLSARHAAALGAFTAMSDQFREYRGNVIKEYGSEVDQKMLVGDSNAKKLPAKAGTDEEGNDDIVEVDAVDLSVVDKDLFTFRMNYRNPNWDDGSYLYAENMIVQLQKNLQARFDWNKADHIFLSKALEVFGFDQMPEYKNKCKYAAFYGWMNHPGAEVKISWAPYVEVFPADEASEQFPMEVPIDTGDDDQWSFFRYMYANDPEHVGYYIKFEVDSDENGIPQEIYTKVYGN